MDNNNKKRVALYERVSTYEQVKHGYSLSAQAKELRDYAERNNFEIVGEYVEDGVSGASINRPALSRLLQSAENSCFDAVLVYKQDRLSRSTKDTIEIVEKLIEDKVEIISLNENIDWSSPVGRATLKMMATFSEMERENIMERTAMGKAYKAASGIYSNHSRLPVGYKWNEDAKRLEPDEEAEQIVKIFELYNSGMSMRSISRYMRQNYSNKYGNYSYSLAVKSKLYNPIYAGYYLHNDVLVKAKNVTPIIDFETYLKAEKRREENRNLRIKSDSPYLLVGLLQCGICGRRYSLKRYDHSSSKKKYLYHRYGCEARIRFDKDFHEKKCTESPIINQQELESKVIEAAKSIDFKKGTKDAAVGNINILMDEITALKEKISKLLDLYESDLIDKNALETRILAHNKKISRNETLVAELADKAKSQPLIDIPTIKEKLASFDLLPFSEKRTVLKSIINKIVIYQSDIDIVWNVK